MGERNPHLPLVRLEPVTPRRTKGGGARVPKPDDEAQHATNLLASLDAAEQRRGDVAFGFDPRLLLKLKLVGLDPTELEQIEGFQVVSQEENVIVVLFASAIALTEFRRRLALIQSGQSVTRAELLYAVQRVDVWSPEDRTGPALRQEGLGEATHAVLDIELWPLDRPGDRGQLIAAFRTWCDGQAMRVLDYVDQPSLLLFRIRTAVDSVHALLRHRDIRLVDLPPRIQLDTELLDVTLQQIGKVPSPPETAPGVVVLDSGLASNHPLMAPAVGDSQSFLPELDAQDENGHGTAVAGLALYGDVAACVEGRAFVPELRIFSGRVLDAEARNTTELLEKQITRAVDYFVDHYGTKIFNLSVGDDRKPYSGGHVRGLAVTLDELSRSRGVLFVVAAGNYAGEDEPSPKWRSEYPKYLHERNAARILDPAPALNVLTVGSLARYEQSRQMRRYPTDPGERCIARADQPSPFTRTGPGPGKAIKPELVEYGGNYSMDARDLAETPRKNALLGELSLSHDVASGRLVVDRVGTSYAAPKVAHIAAKLLVQYPKASPNLIRALLVASAEVPKATTELPLGEEELRQLVGYGKPSDEAAIFSSERRVTLTAEGKLAEDAHHFYELPLPADFLGAGRCERRITVATAHTPLVRTTRADYRASRLYFHLIAAPNLDRVTKVFRRTSKKERQPMQKEVREGVPGQKSRGRGTVQAGRYELRQIGESLRDNRLFIVVTRLVPAWAAGFIEEEPYALVVCVEERATPDVRLYTQIQQLIRQRERVRQRA